MQSSRETQLHSAAKRNGVVQCAAAAAAKSLQSCPTLCGPIDGSPPGSSVHGILQARILERVAISFGKTLKSKERGERRQTQKATYCM